MALLLHCAPSLKHKAALSVAYGGGLRASEAVRAPNGRFLQGNPGKAAGTRNRATLAVEFILGTGARKLTRRAVELALGADTVALRLCLERIAPIRRDRAIAFALPAVEGLADHAPD